MVDSVGDRMKRYEASFQPLLIPNMPVIVRVDGRAFHTLTRRFERPFDQKLIGSMVYATRNTAIDMAGFELAYTQSDEASFMLSDQASHEAQAWFGNNLSKLVSIIASTFTMRFNQCMYHTYERWEPATFDARAFNIPREDAPNYFLWRQRDWERNSLQMLARTHFSHKDLHEKGREAIHEMLHEVGVNWADLSPQLKNGTYILQSGNAESDVLPKYDAIKALMALSQAEERIAQATRIPPILVSDAPALNWSSTDIDFKHRPWNWTEDWAH
jgi:tRNA(His) 5'-end guanylyltransferase